MTMLTKDAREKMNAVDHEALDWASRFIGGLDGDLKRIKVYMLVTVWVAEARYEKLPTKTRERIWAVIYLLTQQWYGKNPAVKE